MIVYKVYEITKYAAFLSFLKYTDFLIKMNQAKVNSIFRVETVDMDDEEFEVAREAASEVNKATIAGWKRKKQ